MSGAFYSEHDPFAAAWLRELIREGLIPDGVVDERDIRAVNADDLRGFTQVHLFAGVGGWSLALRLAGVGDDERVWTGSCPCQPFSSAGKRQAQADDRHLWPAMHGLVRECRPHVVYGEQVEGAVRLGWLDGVSADLEGEGYAVGSAVLGAHSVGAPHRRQRLYWVADAGPQRRERRPDAGGPDREGAGERREGVPDARRCCGSCRVGDATGERRREAGTGCRPDAGPAVVPSDSDSAGVVGDPLGQHLRRHAGDAPRPEGRSPCGGEFDGAGGVEPERAGASGFWDAFDLIPCRDGKARRVEPGTFPLAHGVPGRVGLLRGYGNAICPQTAALFVRAHREVTGG